jgi:phosphoribosyl-AMP cyclohydrolase
MNRESLKQTAATGMAVYWSRSKQRLWKKGESSGHVQRIRQISTDCDKDAILLTVEQTGGIACHTGRYSCFHFILDENHWKVSDPVIKDPELIYKSST